MKPTKNRPTTDDRQPATGFTLVELLVAMFITVLLGSVIVMAYNTSMQSYYRTEKQLEALAAFRNTTDRMEREVNSVVVKSMVFPHPVVANDNPGGSGDWWAVFWDTRIKYLHADARINAISYAWTLPETTSRDGGTTRSGSITHDGVANGTIVIGGGASWSVPGGGLLKNEWWKADPAGHSLFKINFRPRYMGYYSSLDGFTIDRTEWYYNPPEERRHWADGLDNDGDDPWQEGGLRILYDDRGCLMFRKKFDDEMLWREWDLTMADPVNHPNRGPNNYRDNYHGPYSGMDFPPAIDGHIGPADGIPDELQGPLTEYWDNGTPGVPSAGPDGTPDNIDSGTVIGEGFADLRFYYIYKLQHTDQFQYADWWPWDDDNDPTNANGKDPNMPKKALACTVGGSWNLSVNKEGTPNTPDWHGPAASPDRPAGSSQVSEGFDICYFSLPLGISVRFTFKVGRQRHIYEKVIYLHQSRWLKYLNP